MTGKKLGTTADAALSSARVLADQTFARAAGAPLVPGNTVRILKDAKENYPAWLEAIASARSTIHFETYIIHQDDIGLQFAEALAERARQGVRVRLLYDWLGSFSFSSAPLAGRCWLGRVSRSDASIPRESTDPSDGSVETIARS